MLPLTSSSLSPGHTEKDYTNPGTQSRRNPTLERESPGLTGGAFGGLVVAMFVIGVALGMVGYLAYGRYQARKRDGGAMDVASVRFKRQRNDDEAGNE